eukprot:7440617-Pyramimonas_sp.AAC.1
MRAALRRESYFEGDPPSTRKTLAPFQDECAQPSGEKKAALPPSEEEEEEEEEKEEGGESRKEKE